MGSFWENRGILLGFRIVRNLVSIDAFFYSNIQTKEG